MNVFENIPEKAPEELSKVLLSAGDVRIERIVSFGQASPPGFWYDQREDEWVMLLEGRAVLQVEGEAHLIEMGPGDCVHIPAGRRHRVEQTFREGKTVWIAVFYK